MVDRLRKTYLPFEVSFGKPQEKPKKVTKKELARLAKEAGEEYFYADCKKHGKKAKHSISSGNKCTVCKTEWGKKYYEENKESLLERMKKYHEENREVISERSKKYYEENREVFLERAKNYRGENREAILEYQKKYREENKEICSERKKKCYEKNREAYLEQSKKYYEENKESLLEHQKKYRKENAAYIFARSVLSRLNDNSQEAFSGITKVEAEALCGYSQVEFILHIESTFKEGMSWENRSEWHIDHILPVAWFKEQGVTDIKVINALSNLRAEWASDNFSKGRNFLEEDLTEEEFLEIIMNEVDDGKDF